MQSSKSLLISVVTGKPLLLGICILIIQDYLNPVTLCYTLLLHDQCVCIHEGLS
jgi:hypothetical protein